LAALIDASGAHHAFYIGGGSAPLLSDGELATIALLLQGNPDALVANNFFSADFVGFTPAAAIRQIDLPRMDNDLPFRLQREAGLRNVPLTRTAGTQLDVDTPTDLLILSLHPGVGPHTRHFLESAALDTTRVREVMKCFVDPDASIVVCGRVGSYVWAHIDTDIACRTRIISEERGMRANGREARGEVRSLLGFLLETVGSARFFDYLAELGDAAFIDTRVLWAHLGIEASASDRFNSDLLRPREIEHAIIRDFTQAALEAKIPVVLGGHSLVAGGLWALIEAAWLQHDRESKSV
ncbi:MAG: hypothetical protein ACYDAK_14145, partial [Candidatus Limnocylindrales bacterium]